MVVRIFKYTKHIKQLSPDTIRLFVIEPIERDADTWLLRKAC